MKYVILGTAHGVNVGGKHSPDKSLREYLYSREICQRVAKELKERGVDCCIDIEGDTEPSLTYRANLVNSIVKKHGGAANCIYVSIHNNAAGGDGQWHNARGFVVYAYTKASTASKVIATIFARNAKVMDLKGNRAWPTLQYYTANFAVLRETSCPAVLTENLFQDNKADVQFLLSEEGKKTIVDLHVKSILDYIKP